MCMLALMLILKADIIRWLFSLLIVYRFECYGLVYVIVIWYQFTDAGDITLFVTIVFSLGDCFFTV